MKIGESADAFLRDLRTLPEPQGRNSRRFPFQPTMPNKAAIVLVYNHRYDANIDVLERLYADRFSGVFHLVPFYDGPRRNVIPVYENSYRFEGYIAQGFREYFREEFEHYLFVADDLLLHPGIHEGNYAEWFGLGAEGSFVPELFSLHDLHNDQTLRFEPYRRGGETKFHWWRVRDLARYKHRVEGLENSREMPTYAEAEAILRRHGHTVEPLRFADLYGPPPAGPKPRAWWEYLKKLRHFRGEYRLDYPLVASFSDLAVVSKASVRKFAHYCGVFAANGLFVEAALPTALLLASAAVTTEPQLKKRGSIYWTYTPAEAEAFAAAMRPHGNNLERLLQNFPADKLYIHPVKLSRWRG